MIATTRQSALQVTVQVQISGLTVPVNSVTLTHEINNLPYVEISLQLDNQDAQSTQIGKIGSVEINLRQFDKLGALFQEHILNDFSLVTDLQVYVQDGDGNNLLFKGYLGKPQFSIQAGQLILGITGVHAMAVLQAFNGQIYGAQESYGTELFSEFFSDSTAATSQVNTQVNQVLSAIEKDPSILGTIQALSTQLKNLENQPVKNDSIAQRIRVITNGILSKFVNQPGFPTEEPLDLAVHALNQQVLPYVNAFLNGSTASTIIPNISDLNFSDEALHIGIFRNLTGQVHFLAAVAAIAPDFLFQINAQWNSTSDSPGLWLEHLFINAPTDGRLIQAAVMDVNFSMSSMMEIPLLQVIVQGPGDESYGYNGEMGPYQGAPIDGTAAQPGASLRSRARYPAVISKNSAGSYLVVDAPSWINRDKLAVLDVSMSNPPFADPFANAVIGQQNNLNSMLAQETLRQDMLAYMAEFIFKDYYLNKTYAGLDIPLNCAVQVGRTYSVKSATGSPIFDGYLSRVIHQINLQSNGGQAVTHLDFTHVRPQGSKITVLDNLPPSPLIAVDQARSLTSTSSSIPVYSVSGIATTLSGNTANAGVGNTA